MRPSSDILERHPNLFPEVHWDRFVELGNEFDIYGWIARGDRRSDFMLIEVPQTKASKREWCFVTSSSRWSANFSRRLDEFEGAKSEHTDCQRVESLGLNVNAIKLEAYD